jgi:hypothetical protein
MFQLQSEIEKRLKRTCYSCEVEGFIETFVLSNKFIDHVSKLVMGSLPSQVLLKVGSNQLDMSHL